MSGMTRFGDAPMTVREFLGFYETRPDGEHWELIDGTPYMMTPPIIIHQVIADTIGRLLTDLFIRRGLPLIAARQIGLDLPDEPYYRPEPEVAVIDTDFDLDQRNAYRFELVVEVLSPSDRRVIGKKLNYYRGHGHCHTILLVKPTEVSVEVHRRGPEGWASATLTRLDDRIETPWGPVGTLADVYARTPLVR